MAKDIGFKIVLVGDGGTGKTTYLTRIHDGRFESRYEATIGANVGHTCFTTNTGDTIIFNVWDTAGQEINAVLNEAYYIESVGALVLFDLTCRASFVNCEEWIRKINSANLGCKVPTILIGNKADKYHDNKKRLGRGFRQHSAYGCLHYVEMSTKTNYNIERPFLLLARHLTGNQNLEFQANLNVAPMSFERNDAAEQETRIMEELENENDMQLPDEDFL